MKSLRIPGLVLIAALIVPLALVAAQQKKRSPHKGWSSQRRVLVIIYNPVIEAKEGKKLTELYKWNNPDDLVKQYAADIKHASWDMVEFSVAERIEHDEWPPLQNGFRYNDDSFLRAWEERKFDKGKFDYERMLNRHDVRRKVESGKVDEVWLFGYPGLGCFESCMAGKGAVWCNGSVVEGWKCKRPIFIMGFNYERGVDCMLENLGHRAESLLTRVYGSWKPTDTHLWAQFTRHEKNNPGEAACGNVHFAPNSESDYDWGNKRLVDSTCDDWLENFPKLTGKKKKVDCEEWGKGDMRLHHIWWFRHMPHLEWKVDGIYVNWWKYIIEWDRYGK